MPGKVKCNIHHGLQSIFQDREICSRREPWSSLKARNGDRCVNTGAFQCRLTTPAILLFSARGDDCPCKPGKNLPPPGKVRISEQWHRVRAEFPVPRAL